MKNLYIVAVLAAALAGGTLESASAQSASKAGIKNVVLVHGAFADGSGWAAVAKILEKDGYTVSVAQPPETSYADDVKYARAAIDDELAKQGFIAIAPDLFWRQEPDVDLDVRSEADWQHGLRLYGAYDRDAGTRDIAQTIRAAAKLPESTGKVALQGYCLGALMAFITAARHEVDAAVAYHGGDTEKYLGEVGSLRAPLLMHLGEEDEFISKTAQAQIKAALAKKPNATVYSYPGQRHAFSRHNGTHYNATAAALANGRTSEFLNQHLR